MNREAVHARRWWCPYCRAWMSATLTLDVDDEAFVECLNCHSVIARVRPVTQPTYAGVQ